MGQHIISLKVYLKVFIALLFLTAVTVLIAKPVTGVDFGILNTFMAMLVATIKASLVSLFFMHLLYDTKAYAVIFIGSILTLLLMLGFIYFDAVTREVVEKTLL